MTEFKPGDVVRLRSGSPSMVIVDSWKNGDFPPNYVLMWHEDGKVFQQASAKGVALERVPSQPTVAAQTLDLIRGLCQKFLDGDRSIQVQVARTVLELIKENGL